MVHRLLTGEKAEYIYTDAGNLVDSMLENELTGKCSMFAEQH